MFLSLSKSIVVSLLIVSVFTFAGLSCNRLAANGEEAENVSPDKPGTNATEKHVKIAMAIPDIPLSEACLNINISLPLEKIHIKVYKKERLLELYYSGKDKEVLLKSYPIALGQNPEGPKEREGDSRTPEGEYFLIPHHPSPGFGSSFYISYPNIEDAAIGLERGRINRSQKDRITSNINSLQKPPHATGLGGLILLHGTKDRSATNLTGYDWTDGCIAMENPDIIELLKAIPRSARPIMSVFPQKPVPQTKPQEE